MSTDAPSGVADLSPVDRLQQQRAWNWYDWANSAYYTTVLSVLFAPYMSTVAGRAAGCTDDTDSCDKTVNLLGLHLAAQLPRITPDMVAPPPRAKARSYVDSLFTS